MTPIITRIDFSVDALADDGLSGGLMEKLSSVVAIAGPNGAGKTRLLRRIRKLAAAIPQNETYESEYSRLNQLRLKRLAGVNGDDRAQQVKQRMDLIGSFRWDGSFESPIRIIGIDPLPPQLRSVADARKHEIREAVSITSDQSFPIDDKAFLTVQGIADAFLDATHSRTSLTEVDREWSIHQFNTLNSIIEELLDTRIDAFAYGDARLFGRPLNSTELSNGQFRLLAFATAFFRSGNPQSPTIVIMDEPESHLHPEAVIRVLDRIRSLAGNIQIWLATHSLALLASLDPSSMFFIKEGVVSYSGNRTEEVLLSLMGGTENIEKLASFLSSPATFAMHNFVAECVWPPAVAENANGDPQMHEIVKAVQALDAHKLRLIDWGAGRGRLAATFQDRLLVEKTDEGRLIDYIAYDPVGTYREECITSMQGIVKAPAECYFNLLSALFQHTNDREADLVVMCNVLHELDPVEWPKILRNDVAEVLQTNGFLLIAEDLLLPHGECANSHGFLVPDEIALRKLFRDEGREIIACMSQEDRYKDRLGTFLVPRKLLENVDLESLTKACEWVRDHAKRRVCEIRDENDQSYKRGRELAFHLSQFANSSLILEAVGMGLA